MPAPRPSSRPAGSRSAVVTRLGGLAVGGLAIASLVFAGLALGGAAYAVSGGGYTPHQQGCQAVDADYATPAGQVYPGCHNMELNLESGGVSQGVPSDGNTDYAQIGLDQSPNDPHSTGTPTPYSIGLPGSSGSPHAGCVAVNTDGTGGRPAPPGPPEPPGAADSSSYGCGNNPAGSGFSSNFDYYQYYCPIAQTLGFACEAGPPARSSLTPDTGPAVAIQPILSNGLLLYYGMDDNSDNGEHDGLGPYSTSPAQANTGAINGPSDGGAIMALLSPATAAARPSPTRPEGAANASSGFCADGICVAGTTEQQAVYSGCGAGEANGQAPCQPGTPSRANAYDYAPGGNPANDPSVSTEPAGCNSGGSQTSGPSACGPGGMNALRAAVPATEYVEPGVQLYADPDPQRSPAAPSPLWPTPGLYVGTCGVYAGSPATTGQVLGRAPLSLAGLQLTNAAGQVALPAPGAGC